MRTADLLSDAPYHPLLQTHKHQDESAAFGQAGHRFAENRALGGGEIGGFHGVADN